MMTARLTKALKITSFFIVVGFLLLCSLGLTVPEAQAQGIVPPFPNAINLNPHYDVITYDSNYEYFGISDIESIFGSGATPVSVFGSVNFSTTGINRFKYDEIENKWNSAGSGTGGPWNFVFTNSNGTAFATQYGLSPEVYIAQPKEFGLDGDGIYMFTNHGRGATKTVRIRESNNTTSDVVLQIK
ncbi:MAG: hypothetical protein QXI16_03000, partial [Sulfolobaceae archaeon]